MFLCKILKIAMISCLEVEGKQIYERNRIDKNTKFLSVYYRMPTVVQIEVENDGLADFPAVTICNTNRVRRSEFCRRYPDNCTSDDVSLSEKEIHDMVFKLLFKEGGASSRNALGHSNTIVQSCVFNGKPALDQGQCMSLLELSYDPDFGNCYTVPGHIPGGIVLEAREADFWQEENDLVLLLDLETEEFMESKRHPGLLVTIHDDSTLPDIHTDSIQLSPGYSYTFGMQKSTVRLLQKPYKTNCTNFEKLPWHSDLRRDTSRMCTVGCSQHFQLTECGLITKNLSLFYSNLPYTLESLTPESKRCAKDVELRTQDYCRTVCGLPCRDTSFPVTVGSSKLTKRDLHDYSIHAWRNRTWDENLKNLAIVKIFFTTLEHKIFRHRPKYESMELFSYLGGYSGVWLGFSLLTVYEMLEICVRTFLRAWSRRKSKGSRSNRRRKKRTAKKIFFHE